MIPKIIHYCWFGGKPLPQLALNCIASWRKYLPDYEIVEWNESNFNFNDTPYTREAYRQKKYAYVSDYARFWIIYHYGGIYFDTDVEVIRPLDDIIKGSEEQYTGFMGFEQDPDGTNTPGTYAPRYCFSINPGLGFGMTKGHPFAKMMVEHYQTLQFQAPPRDIAWYKTITAYTTEELCRCGLCNITGTQTVRGVTEKEGEWSIQVYPSEFFAPINAVSRRLHVTPNTLTIHRYMASWGDLHDKKIKDYLRHYLPEFLFFAYNRFKRREYRIK